VKTENDSVIKVYDVAELRRNFKDPENFARLNGKRAIALEIVKRSGENIIETIETVREVVEKERQYWPENVDVTYTQDRSDGIRTMLSDLQNNVISAILLVMIVIVAVLGLRSAGLVGIAIPGAFLTGILVLYSMGLSVNIVVLFSLILSVGMLVDGAIVVTEYADRKMAEGVHRKKAYGMAAKRMAWPITASTATTLAAFAPLMFWPGIVGEFMKYLPLTLICVLSSSLLMAMIFVPTLGSLMGKAGAVDEKTVRNLAAAETGRIEDIKGLTGWYLGFLEKALGHSGKILIGAVFLLIGVQVVYGKIGKGVEFFPDIEPEVATVLIHGRGNLSVYEKDQLVREVEDLVYDVKGIESFYVRSGKSAQKGSDLAEDVIGQIQLEFMEWDERRSADEILSEIKQRTANLAGVYIETQKQEGGPPTGKDVQIQIGSRFPELLPGSVEIIREAFDELGGFEAIEDSRPLPGIQWELKVDRAQASKFNLDISTIGQYVRMVTNGLQVAEYRPDDTDEEIDVVIRHPVHERTIDQLDRVRVTAGGVAVPVSNFIERVAQPSVGTISRSEQKRIMTVKADVGEGENINARVEEIRSWIEENKGRFSPDIEITFKGEDEDQREAQDFLMKAFTVALFIMAIILVTQFNSFYSAFLILSAVIMSTIGVFIGLMITGQPFGIVMSGIGVIALAGIIVNNNIVLIDTFDHMRRDYGDKMDVRELILRTGAQRLRPVLLTTITTVLGLMPMVLQMNVDFIGREVSVGAPSTQWWVQLSTAVAFGLTFSTILTLVLTPCALMFRERAGFFMQKIKSGFIAKKTQKGVDSVS
jgi:multidrug efflux pump